MNAAFSKVAEFPIMGQVNDERFDKAIESLRELIYSQADRLARKIDDHANEDREAFAQIGDRVLTIEVERAGEKSDATKRQVFTVLGLSAAITGAWKLIDYIGTHVKL